MNVNSALFTTVSFKERGHAVLLTVAFRISIIHYFLQFHSRVGPWCTTYYSIFNDKNAPFSTVSFKEWGRGVLLTVVVKTS